MNIASRLADYALTGGFFLISQGIFVLLYVGSEDALSCLTKIGTALTALLEAFPSALQPMAASLIIGLSFIAVFLIGLFLDLLGSYFVICEAAVFKKHLESNRTWLNSLMKKHNDYIGDKYDQLTGQFGNLWNPLKSLARFKLLKSYERLRLFFTSYVLVFSDATNLELFMNSIRLWRMSRAVSTTFLVLSVQATFVVPTSDMDWLSIAAQYIFFILSAWITLRSYSRLSYILFALTYVSHEKLRTASHQNTK